jgi:hypothetical protein
MPFEKAALSPLRRRIARADNPVSDDNEVDDDVDVVVVVDIPGIQLVTAFSKPPPPPPPPPTAVGVLVCSATASVHTV